MLLSLWRLWPGIYPGYDRNSDEIVFAVGPAGVVHKCTPAMVGAYICTVATWSTGPRARFDFCNFGNRQKDCRCIIMVVCYPFYNRK